MTNFEKKWKSDLTPVQACELFFEVCAEICDNCPEVYYCDDSPQAYRPSCEAAFLKWANREAT